MTASTSTQDEGSWEFVSQSASSSDTECDNENINVVDSHSNQDTNDNNTYGPVIITENMRMSLQPTEDRREDQEEHSHFHRSFSTPMFTTTIEEDEESFAITDCDSSVDVQSIMTNATTDDMVLLSHKSNSNTAAASVKKVPSFKDMLLLNSKQKEKEEQEKQTKLKEVEEKLRRDALKRRKMNRPRLVVNPIQRCAKSTGDLRSLIIHEGDEEGGDCGGGGGGVIYEDEIMGETDAMEFYNRKSKGSSSRSNGKKLRPDEAKRKMYIVHKKNAQRSAQKAREGGK